MKHSDSKTSLPGSINSKIPQDFENDYLELIGQGINKTGIVYVLNTTQSIPRLRGKSRVVYVGKTKQSLQQRYPASVVREDTSNYWRRYKHIIKEYGPITIDVYPCDDPDQAENNFLFEYFEEHLEGPPLNTTSFRTKRLNKQQFDRYRTHY